MFWLVSFNGFAVFYAIVVNINVHISLLVHYLSLVISVDGLSCVCKRYFLILNCWAVYMNVSGLKVIWFLL